MTEPGGMPGIVSCASLACRRYLARFHITGLDKLYQRGMLQGFRAYLPGFPGSQKQLFPTGQGNTQRLAGLVDNIHERAHGNMNWVIVQSSHSIMEAFTRKPVAT